MERIMDYFVNAKQKLHATLAVLNTSQDYTTDLKTVLESLDNGLQFTKTYYSEVNNSALAKNNKFNGSDIYFYFIRYTHQFFNIINAADTLANASYYEKYIHLINIRQDRFDILKAEAIAKATEILEQ